MYVQEESGSGILRVMLLPVLLRWVVPYQICVLPMNEYEYLIAIVSIPMLDTGTLSISLGKTANFTKLCPQRQTSS